MNGFDIKINELKSSSANQIIKLLDTYKKEHGFINYNSALDSFAYKFGIGYVMVVVVDEKDEFYGYSPTIKYYPDNALDMPPQDEELYLNNVFKNKKEAEKLLAKEVIYRLMRVVNPEKYLI